MSRHEVCLFSRSRNYESSEINRRLIHEKQFIHKKSHSQVMSVRLSFKAFFERRGTCDVTSSVYGKKNMIDQCGNLTTSVLHLT